MLTHEQIRRLLNLKSAYIAVVANGEFPNSDEVFGLLKNAECIIACDGAGNHLNHHAIVPDYIVGDADSTIATTAVAKHPYVFIDDQNCNDLTKAVQFIQTTLDTTLPIIIFAASGLREDHMIANFALLAQYKSNFNSLFMISDYGIFMPLASGVTTLPTIIGQQVSFFSFDASNSVTCHELKWQLLNAQFPYLNSGTLNQVTSDYITITTQQPIIVYLSFEIKSS